MNRIVISVLGSALGALCIVASASMLSACGSGPCDIDTNTLEGSISEMFEIAPIDSVTARFSESDQAVTIDFKRGNDSLAKVVADTTAFAIGAKIPLVDGDVYRVTSPASDFPRDIAAGTITFETELTVGNEVEGCFNVRFNANDGTERTLEGAFQTTLMGGL